LGFGPAGRMPQSNEDIPHPSILLNECASWEVARDIGSRWKARHTAASSLTESPRPGFEAGVSRGVAVEPSVADPVVASRPRLSHASCAVPWNFTRTRTESWGYNPTPGPRLVPAHCSLLGHRLSSAPPLTKASVVRRPCRPSQCAAGSAFPREGCERASAEGNAEPRRRRRRPRWLPNRGDMLRDPLAVAMRQHGGMTKARGSRTASAAAKSSRSCRCRCASMRTGACHWVHRCRNAAASRSRGTRAVERSMGGSHQLERAASQR